MGEKFPFLSFMAVSLLSHIGAGPTASGPAISPQSGSERHPAPDDNHHPLRTRLMTIISLMWEQR